MRTLAALSFLVASQARRVNFQESEAIQVEADEELTLDLDSASNAWSLAQHVSMASGFLNATEAGELDESINKMCDTIWPRELDAQFRDKRVVGSGATACVFLAIDATDTLVAVKVGKSSSGKDKEAALASWTKECNEMQSMRMKGCRAGKDVLALHQAYLPTCTMVGPHKSGAYYVMHAAGTDAIKDVPNLGFSEATRKKIFAEFVASVHALHTVDLTHNDLHGQNIVLKGESLALIDFGSLKTLQRSWKKDYKRDGSAIWRWGAVLGDCPLDAQWPNPPTSSAGNKFVSCMQKFSGGDPKFMSAIKNVVNGAVHEWKDHGVTALYNTPFVQNNMPSLKTNYPWEGEGDCLSWPEDTWLQFEFDEKFPGYVKCDTLPSYKRIKTRTKRGKTRSTEVVQCDIPGMSFQSACWHRNPMQIWACGGCGGGIVSVGATGGCLMPSHPQYKYATDANPPDE